MVAVAALIEQLAAGPARVTRDDQPDSRPFRPFPQDPMAPPALAEESEFVPFVTELQDELSRVDKPPFFNDGPRKLMEGDFPHGSPRPPKRLCGFDPFVLEAERQEDDGPVRI